jgi:hypothetical protein
MLEPCRRYDWAEDEDIVMSWTAAVIQGQDKASVIRAYGGNPDTPIGTFRFNDAHVPIDDVGDYLHIQVMTHDDAVIAIEPNGWAGSSETTASRASQSGGRFFSVYWSPVATRITQAVDGKIVAHFDPLNAQPPERLGETLPTWLDQIIFTTEKLNATMLVAMELETGVAFDPTWLNEPMPTYRVPPP